MEKLIRCYNCGAGFEESKPRCPYCDAINEIGAEKQYMDKMGSLKEELKDLSQVPADAYKKEMLKTWKKIAVITAVFVVLSAVISGVLYLNTKMVENASQADIMEQLRWEQENFPELDKLYEKGDYDTIVELKNQAYEEGYHIWDWEHSDFIGIYEGYQWCLELREDLTDRETANKGTAQYLLGEVMRFLFFLKEENFAEEEWQALQSWKPIFEEMLYEDMRFTKEEAEELYMEINDEGRIQYQACDKYAEKIWERFIR